VKKNGFPFTSENYEAKKKPYDELVIDQEAQIVPIFLVKVSFLNPDILNSMMGSTDNLPLAVYPEQVSLDTIPLDETVPLLPEGSPREDYSTLTIV